MESKTDEMYPLAPVDDVLRAVGLPRTEPLLEAISPENVLGKKMGLRSPGEVIETLLEDIDSKGTGVLPKLPGMR